MHTILVIEDDRAVARVFGEMCAAIECKPVYAETLAEVKQRIEEGGFCAVLLDLQIPADVGGLPLVSGGETALALLRKYDRRRSENGSVLPIITITGYSSAWDFVAHLFKAGVDDFIPKSLDDGSGRPFGERMEMYLGRVREALVKAGRADHALCEALERTRPAPAAARPVVTVRVGSDTNGKRFIARVNGEPRELQRSSFLLLARLALAHRRTPSAYVPHADLGVRGTSQTIPRLREALGAALPEDTVLVESKYGAGLRLQPDVRVEIDDAALARHPDETIRRLFRAAGRS